MKKTIKHLENLEQKVLELGFLPFFINDIKGFSVEEMTPSEYWFSRETDGPWEWKGPVIRNLNCTYGKFFRNKAGFVSMDWFAEFVNYRRSIYPLIKNSAKGSANDKDRILYDTIVAYDSLLSKELKFLCGYSKVGAKRFAELVAFKPKGWKAPKYSEDEKIGGFDTSITRLQMGTHIIVADFEYSYDVEGNPYGWGIARYTTPEALFGTSMFRCRHSAEKSKELIFKHLKKILPKADDEDILRMIG